MWDLGLTGLSCRGGFFGSSVICGGNGEYRDPSTPLRFAQDDVPG